MKHLFLTSALWLALAGTALAVVNINTATKEELSTLKGIGGSKAQAIIDYRKKHGDFKSIDDLGKVEGIGPDTLKKLRGQLSLSGKTAIEKPAQRAKAAKPGKTRGKVTKADKGKSKVAQKPQVDDKSKMALKNQPANGALEKKSPTSIGAGGTGAKKLEKK